MERITKKEIDFVGYEYSDITVKSTMDAMLIDCYANFGWMLEEKSNSMLGNNYVNLKFKRDRKIRNKAELSRLQSKFESCINEIEKLNKSKKLAASVFAYTIGIVGTAFMAASVFSYEARMLVFSIFLAIPGFLGWVLPYFSYVKIQNKKSEEVKPLIDKQQDMIYVICEKANSLLPN